MKRLVQTALALAGTIAITSAAMGQSFNFSVNTPSGPGAVTPASSFGAAADQAGHWNSHVGAITAGTPIALLDLNGAATSVSFTTSGDYLALSGSTNLVGATADQSSLLAGFWDISGSAGFVEHESFTFTGLANGMYNVYTYAMSPSSAGQFTRVNVNGESSDGAPGVQVVGGAFTGDFALGITHALHTAIEVTDGSLVINAESVNFGSIAGMQLQLIPAPGALALLGIAGLASRRRQRM